MKTNPPRERSTVSTQVPISTPVVWVTGSGAPRVGRTVAEYFARYRYRVALHSHRSIGQADEVAGEWIGRGVDCMVTQGDICDMNAMQSAVDSIISTFGRLDATVHCAAIWDWKPLEETTSEDVRRHLEINTLGSYHVAKTSGLAMVKQSSGGALVLIGDWAVARPYPDFSAYFAGKGAIETLVRSMAVEMGTRNPSVRVNGILPGPVMLDPSIDPRAAETIRRACLLQRHGSPEHVAAAAYFLATHEFITGACLPVDGGRTIWSGVETDRIAHPTYPVDQHPKDTDEGRG
jgi:NAD(P)-dependent dehydrogenase (short-subunit alcohol dehydrogenase family)